MIFDITYRYFIVTDDFAIQRAKKALILLSAFLNSMHTRYR